MARSTVRQALPMPCAKVARAPECCRCACP